MNHSERPATIAAIVGILGAILSIVTALTRSDPIFSWIALIVALIALGWYFLLGPQAKRCLIFIALGALAVIAIGVALWIGPVTVEVTVYVDEDSNGIREGREPTVGAGMEVRLLDRNGVSRVAVTNGEGVAIFLDVPQGPYGMQLGAPGISGIAERFSPGAIVAIVAISPTPALSLTPSPTHTSTPTPTETATPTNTPTPSPTPIVIDTMDNVSGWSIHSDTNSTIQISSERGIEDGDGAIGISYTLTPDNGNWVLISRPLNMQPLSGTTRGIRFFCSGSGDYNSIELKLLYAPDNTGQSVTFVKLWPAATVSLGDRWRSLEALYTEFDCGETCPPSGQLDLEEVRTINFAISNAEGGSSGSGTVIFDHVVGFR